MRDEVKDLVDGEEEVLAPTEIDGEALVEAFEPVAEVEEDFGGLDDGEEEDDEVFDFEEEAA